MRHTSENLDSRLPLQVFGVLVNEAHCEVGFEWNRLEASKSKLAGEDWCYAVSELVHHSVKRTQKLTACCF
jgi:hypothetical protein